MIISEPSPLFVINLKEKRARSPSSMKEAEKTKNKKGLSSPSDLTSSSRKVPIIGEATEVGTPLDLGVAAMVDVDENLEA